MFTTLKKHATLVHKELHGDTEHLSEAALSSLAYRYMVAKEHDYTEAHEQIG
jgi:hypothetical protein